MSYGYRWQSCLYRICRWWSRRTTERGPGWYMVFIWTFGVEWVEHSFFDVDCTALKKSCLDDFWMLDLRRVNWLLSILFSAVEVLIWVGCSWGGVVVIWQGCSWGGVVVIWQGCSWGGIVVIWQGCSWGGVVVIWQGCSWEGVVVIWQGCSWEGVVLIWQGCSWGGVVCGSLALDCGVKESSVATTSSTFNTGGSSRSTYKNDNNNDNASFQYGPAILH
jgi:hypothetical protein